MALTGNAIGSSAVMQPSSGSFSILQRVFTHTPGGMNVQFFFPFSDINFVANPLGNSEVGPISDVPVIIHSAPGSADLKRVDMPLTAGADGSKLSKRLSKNDSKAFSNMFGERLIEYLWPFQNGDDDMDASTDNIKLFVSEESAKRWLGDRSDTTALAGLRVAIIASDKYVKICYSDNLIWNIARKVRDMVEIQKGWKPSIMPIGLGHVDTSRKFVAPFWRWNAGTARTNNYRSNIMGWIDIPLDQVPHGQLKQVAAYWNPMLQASFAYYKSLSANLGMPKASGSVDSGGFDRAVFGTLQMWLGSRGGFTSSVSAPSTPIDMDSTVNEFNSNIAAQFGAGYVQMDLHPNRYKDKDKYKDHIATLIVTEAVISACLPKVQTAVYPAHCMADGGARSETVVEQLYLNYKEDYNFGGTRTNTLPVTLIPTSISLGEKVFRVPSCFNPISSREDIKLSNLWFGPGAPYTMDDIIPVEVIGDKPTTQIDKETYYASPRIINDSIMQKIYYDRRNYNCMWVNRPSTFVEGLTDLAHIYAQMADTAPVSGPYYEQVLNGSPLINRENKLTLKTLAESSPSALSDEERNQIIEDEYDDPTSKQMVDNTGPVLNVLPGNIILEAPSFPGQKLAEELEIEDPAAIVVLDEQPGAAPTETESEEEGDR